MILQNTDIIFISGRKYFLKTRPLDSFFGEDTWEVRDNHYAAEILQKEYSAFWAIEEHKLFLLDVNPYFDEIKLLMETKGVITFSDSTESSKLYADWFSGELKISKLGYFPNLEHNSVEAHTRIKIENGKVVFNRLQKLIYRFREAKRILKPSTLFRIVIRKSIALKRATIKATISFFWIYIKGSKNYGKNYRTVKIGEQIWMSENLSVDIFQNGIRILEAKTKEEWEKAIFEQEPAWCYYDYKKNKKYGKLYNWYAVKDFRNLAPKGWHIPSVAEFVVLETFLEDYRFLPHAIKTEMKKQDANRLSSFSAYLSGYRDFNDSFHSKDTFGLFWSMTECLKDTIYYMRIYKNLDILSVTYTKDNYLLGLSVRCVKD